jgi:hypothetical protein
MRAGAPGHTPAELFCRSKAADLPKKLIKSGFAAGLGILLAHPHSPAKPESGGAGLHLVGETTPHADLAHRMHIIRQPLVAGHRWWLAPPIINRREGSNDEV